MFFSALLIRSNGKRSQAHYRALCREVRQTMNERYPDTLKALETQDTFTDLISARLHGRTLSKLMHSAVLAYAVALYQHRLASFPH